MKRIGSALAILVLSFSLLSTTSHEELITLSITVKPGYGGLPVTFRRLWSKERTDSTWLITQKEITGVPKDWESYARNEIALNIKQLAYQNYKQNKISEAEFKDWEIDLTQKLYSTQPINCFFYAIYGKDKLGNIKCKFDTDNDFDFADEREIIPPSLTEKSINFDSIAREQGITVQYQDFRNDKINTLSAPILVIRSKGFILFNIAQHAESVLDGQIIKISPDGFTSLMYEQVALAVNPIKPIGLEELVNQNEYLLINGIRYKNLGVDPNKQVLKLQKFNEDDVIYSSQPGFNARPFTVKEFTTQQEIALKDYSGKYVFVEFWGTWCGPCVAEIPSLQKVYNKLDKSKIEFLGIARDQPDALRKFLDKNPIAWKQIRCETETEGIIADYNVIGYPTSFLIDPKGKIVAKNLRGENLSDTLNYYINSYP